jgi:SAM-dependent methyltransferase
MTTSMTRNAKNRLGMSTTDRVFDRLLPEELRHLSSMHWTPVDVAVRATSLLCPTSGTRVLDVGSGVGKLCVVGAMSAEGRWCGVEQHAVLVRTANKLADALGVAERTTFLHGDALELDWGEFDAIYLYNPFANPLFDAGDAKHLLDFRLTVTRVQARLATLRERVRVVTLQGFGGVMPASYELVYHERIAGVGLDLALWIQRAAARDSMEQS